MPRERKNKKLRSEAIFEEWLAGKNHRYRGGDVIRSDTNNSIGVIQFALKELETYQVKWHVGPNPWDFVEGVIEDARTIKKVDEPNPLKYSWSQRVPGPSSQEIDKLEAVFAAKASRIKTAKEVELHVSILEEELNKKKALAIDETKVDSIVDETLEEDTEPVRDHGVDRKLKSILEEE